MTGPLIRRESIRLGRTPWRDCADAFNARSAEFLVQSAWAQRARSVDRTGPDAFIVFAQFILFLLILRDVVRLLSANAAAPISCTYRRGPAAIRRQRAPFGGVAGFIVAAIVAAGASPSSNAMAATTLTDFYTPYVNPGADETTWMRVSKQATVAWESCTRRRAWRSSWPARSRCGLSCFRSAPGPVLGAFRSGPCHPRHASARCSLDARGLAVMAVVWWATPIAWTWTHRRLDGCRPGWHAHSRRRRDRQGAVISSDPCRPWWRRLPGNCSSRCGGRNRLDPRNNRDADCRQPQLRRPAPRR